MYGNLYLTEKRDGALFDEEDEAVVTALASGQCAWCADCGPASVAERVNRAVDELDDTIAIQLLTALREALSNAARHAARAGWTSRSRLTAPWC